MSATNKGDIETDSDSEEWVLENAGKKRAARSELFGRSKKTYKGSVKTTTKETKMEELKSMMREMMDEIKEVRKSQSTYQDEMKALKFKNYQLKGRIAALEIKLDRIEIREKKNNIVIKGVGFNTDELKNEVQKFLKNEIKISAKITKAELIKPRTAPPFVVATFETWEGKLNAMEGKRILRGTNKYIDDDLTKEERRVQSELRKLAKLERDKGKKRA